MPHWVGSAVMAGVTSAHRGHGPMPPQCREAVTHRYGERERADCPRASPAPGQPGAHDPPRSGRSPAAAARAGWPTDPLRRSAAPPRTRWSRRAQSDQALPKPTGTTPARPAERAGCMAPPPSPRRLGRIEEHLAATVLPDESRGGECGVKALGTRRDRAGRRRHLIDRRPRPDRYEHVHALAPLVLTTPTKPTSAGTWPTSWAARTASANASCNGGSRSSTRWVGGPSDRRESASGGTPRPAGWRTTATCGGRYTARRTPRALRTPPTAAPSAPTTGCTWGRSSA